MTKTTMRADGSRCSRCPNQINQDDTCYHEPTGDSGKLYCADCGAHLTTPTTRDERKMMELVKFCGSVNMDGTHRPEPELKVLGSLMRKGYLRISADGKFLVPSA